MSSPDRRKNRPRRSSEYRGADLTAGVVFSAGFTIVTSALAGLYLGIALDRRREGTLFTPIGLILGLLVGFHRIYLLFRQISKGRDK